MSVKILVVDDDPQVVDLVRFTLEAEGYRVLPFFASPEAAQCAEEQPLDGAVINDDLPGMDGFALVRRIRASTLNARIGIVMLAEHGDVGTQRQALISGATNFLSKPFTPDKLRKALRNARNDSALWRRHHVRVPFLCELQCECDAAPLKSKLLNISEGGALLRSSCNLSPGNEVVLQFELPKVISFLSPACRVVRKEAPDLLGVEFVDLRTNQRRALRDFVAKWA